MSAFDLVVIVALGSALATVLLTKRVVPADGLTALALLLFLQCALTWLSVCSRAVSRLVKSELPAKRVTKEKALADLRAQASQHLRGYWAGFPC